MKKPHFFKAYSRIGLAHIPYGQKKLNIGVEQGPDAILTGKFLSQFNGALATSFEFPKPEDINKNFYHVLADNVKKFQDVINQNLKSSETQVVIGGDHSITFPSVLAVLQRISDPKSIGYIQFDSHGDINLRAFSPTDNWHGMYVRPLVDGFDVSRIEKLVTKKLPVNNIFYIGNLDLDPGERDFFIKYNIKNICKKELREEKSANIKAFAKFAASFRHLHVTFDIDCIDQSEAPATGIPARDGLFYKDILPLLEIINQHPSISFDLSEVNPKKRGAKETVALAQQILRVVLS
ncbi:MAG: arginase family protein [Candidatus Levybacteria bacterium]|nr:arginase family protein [Candidatus Levybacteria bacterium]